MITIEFKYNLDEKVKLPMGDLGIITMLGYRDNTAYYFVITSQNSTWYKENLLEKV
jgi:hypothetical protein